MQQRSKQFFNGWKKVQVFHTIYAPKEASNSDTKKMDVVIITVVIDRSARSSYIMNQQALN